MLPSKGLFSGIPCVFYLNGGCVRPYCHYRHSAQDIAANEGKFCYPELNESQTNPVEKTAYKALRKQPANKYSLDKTEIVKGTLNTILETPETIKWALARENKVISCSNTIPTYEPTPISKLGKISNPKTSEYHLSTPKRVGDSLTFHQQHVKCSSAMHSHLKDFPEKNINNVEPSDENKRSEKYKNHFKQHQVVTNQHEGYNLQHFLTSGNEPIGNFASSNHLTDAPLNTTFQQAKHSPELTQKCKFSVLHCNSSSDKVDRLSVEPLPKKLHYGNHLDIRNADSHQQDYEKIDHDNHKVQTDDNNFLIRDKNNPGNKKMEINSVKNLVEDMGNEMESTENCVNTDVLGNRSKNSSLHLKKYKRKNLGALQDLKGKQNHNKHYDSYPEKLENKIMNGSDKKVLCSEVAKRRKFVQTSVCKSNNALSNSENICKQENYTNELNGQFVEDLCSTERNMDEEAREAVEGKPNGAFLDVVKKVPSIGKLGASSSRKNLEILKPEQRMRSLEREMQNPLSTVEKRHYETKPRITPLNSDPFIRWISNMKLKKILGKKEEGTTCLIKQSKITNDAHPEELSKLSELEPIPKVVQRIAHKSDNFRPNLISSDNVKVPLTFRQHYSNAFFEELKKTLSLDDAARKAAEQEHDIAKNSKTVKAYKNNCCLWLLKLRKNEPMEEPEKREKEILSPSSSPNFTFGWSLYKCFSKYLLSEEDLLENGYPLELPDQPGKAYTSKSSRRYCIEQPNKPSIKVCVNCSNEFEIDKNDWPITKNDCFYHWGRLKNSHVMGQWMKKFSCCSGFVDSAPCESSMYHVWSGQNEDCMSDFVKTKKFPNDLSECDAGIYALDCEMCYTTKGRELARLTVIDLNENMVFDEVVALKNPVLDFCTRFSGIDQEKVSKASFTFEDVRQWVINHFYDKTILIGHSLENDLKVLKVIHKTVIDTSVTFPHKLGSSHKMSLKHLASSVLGLNIQESEGGHDSKEDAATCMKLIMLKVKQDSLARKPRVIIGYNGHKR